MERKSKSIAILSKPSQTDMLMKLQVYCLTYWFNKKTVQQNTYRKKKLEPLGAFINTIHWGLKALSIINGNKSSSKAKSVKRGRVNREDECWVRMLTRGHVQRAEMCNTWAIIMSRETISFRCLLHNTVMDVCDLDSLLCRSKRCLLALMVN